MKKILAPAYFLPVACVHSWNICEHWHYAKFGVKRADCRYVLFKANDCASAIRLFTNRCWHETLDMSCML